MTWPDEEYNERLEVLNNLIDNELGEDDEDEPFDTQFDDIDGWDNSTGME